MSESVNWHEEYNELAKRTNQLERIVGSISLLLRQDILQPPPKEAAQPAVSEEARKLWHFILNCSGGEPKAIELIEAALQAAEARGAEKKRVGVLADERLFFQSQHERQTRYSDGVPFWPSLQPPPVSPLAVELADVAFATLAKAAASPGPMAAFKPQLASKIDALLRRKGVVK